MTMTTAKPNGGGLGWTYFAELQSMNDLLCATAFYTPMEANTWLFAQHKSFDGLSAAQMIARGRSGEVRQVIEQLRDGAFT
jgi:hypothetical protein